MITGKKISVTLAVAAALGCLATVIVVRHTRREECLNVMRRIDAAKQSFQWEYRLTNGTALTRA